jgi:hypothetical protein
MNIGAGKIALILLAAICCVPMTGCVTFMAATEGPKPPDLSKVQIGVSRQVIERELGKPVQRLNNVSTYEYNTMKPTPLWAAAAVDVFLMGTTVLYWGDLQKVHKAQRSRLSIIYGPKDTVIGPSFAKAEENYLEWLLQGNVKALCQAANAGYGDAQAVQAVRYRYGLWDTEIQPVQAHVWLRLAEAGGYPEANSAVADMAGVMRPEEILEADRRFRDWSTTSCDP